MTKESSSQDTLRPEQEPEEYEVAQTICVRCSQIEHAAEQFEIDIARVIAPRRSAPDSHQRFRFIGVMECCSDYHRGSHRWPIDVENRTLWAQRSMPVIASGQLEGVQPGLVQDIQEAEEAHFHGLFKAAVVLCRRAVQLSVDPLVPKGGRRTLGPVLDRAREMPEPPLTARGFLLADGIKELGDIGAHDVEEVTDAQAKSAIESTVGVLNELAPALAEALAGGGDD